MKTSNLKLISAFVLLLLPLATYAEPASVAQRAETQSTVAQVAGAQAAKPTPQQIAQHKVAKAKKAKQELLQRMYSMRIRLEQERAAAENQARANVRLATQNNSRRIDAPTVSGLRAQTNVALSRFEQQFRCLDVDVEDNSGNTVVICGDNHGDISGRNVSAERDIVTYPGGRP